ncbi:MAG: SDR family NAD(P)-dependent oxidoreductase [Alphaproteobacteria bacterium]|nr:SDR family NAD(P)-dependent oxidoreductase [Alphaproteobacteria bacterium]
MARPGWHRALARAVDAVLDPSIVLSFDQTGYRRHAVQFDEADLDVDLRGRVYVVTGANGGLGKETCRALASRGGTVFMACRSVERGEAARDELRADAAVVGPLQVVACDVADLDSVDALVTALPAERVDGLILNAGALFDARGASPQGLERTLAVHVVGHLRLLAGLLPRMRRDEGPPARVIWVSSGGMYPRKLSVQRLDRHEGSFDGVTAYADCKRAQVVLSEQLAGALRGSGVVCNAMHPGWASTKGVVDSLPTFHAITRRILRTPAEGADTIVWLAVCPAIAERSGAFWFDRRAVSPHLSRRTRASADERAALWQAVHRWAGVDPSTWPGPPAP